MNKSEGFWNKLSKNYDKKAKDEAYKLIVKQSRGFLTSNDVVLDFGCATGLYSFALAKNVKEIHAFDTSSEMINMAKDQKHVDKINNVTFTQTTIFDEDYKKSSFDSILAFNIILYFNDEKKILNRINKLTKTGGLLITSTACLKENRTAIGILSRALIFLFRELKVLPYLKFHSMKGLEKTIMDCGFKIIETSVLIDKPATEYFIVAQKL